MSPAKWDYFDVFRTCSRCVDLNMHEDARDCVESAADRAGDEVKGIRFGLGRRLRQIEKFNTARRQELAPA